LNCEYGLKKTATGNQNFLYIYSLKTVIEPPFMRFLLLVVLAMVVLGSCVPNRKYVYLQKDDLHKKNLVKDTVVRDYKLQIEEYRIQPLDILYIRIESLTDEEFDFMAKLYPVEGVGGGGANQNAMAIRGFLVDQQGEVEFPVVGKVKFGGLTVFEAQDSLQQIFKAFLKDPVARVRLLNFRFTVLGEVNSEGQVISSNTRVTLMEAIGLAGGLGELADRANVKIVRQNGDKAEVFYMNLLDENILMAKNFYIQQNDIIMVPALKQRPFRMYWAQNLSLFVSTVSVILLVINLSK
jgi:polysaccharide biosynthesis/export protein